MQNDRIQKIAKDVIQFEINALKNLKNNIKWKNQVEMIKQIKINNISQTRKEGVGVFPVKSWLDFDENLKYNMF